ncbi:DgyrCDS1880 [Dimorphilus gyrociliatus]|uniref:DgyrCDS1880 n=1 Tax=Dimorphilus gyrociliatus TaxID=2664684 RepID=A0A7I8V8I3_9ANNE|nr:DgyrCDS1880 [Dimorphilus gyrociliatus]
MEKWEGKVAIVTGGSLGIGAECCKTLVDYGMIVIAVARTKLKMRHIEKSLENSKGRYIPRVCNLFNEKDIINLFSSIEKEFGAIHVLVNMASTGTMGNLMNDLDYLWDATMELNVVAPALCCKLAIENMQKYNVKGHLINIGGTASYYTSIFPSMHFYSLSKFILRAIGDGLRAEFRANNIDIRVTHIGPGHCKTGAMSRSGLTARAMLNVFEEYGTKTYGMSPEVIPDDSNLNMDGDEIYECDVLPALEKSDVVDYIVQALELPLGAEIMDIIMKPTDRRHSIYETDLYVKS